MPGTLLSELRGTMVHLTYLQWLLYGPICALGTGSQTSINAKCQLMPTSCGTNYKNCKT